jgi:hypothetical protein
MKTKNRRAQLIALVATIPALVACGLAVIVMCQ